MTDWTTYPTDYRSSEVLAIAAALSSGECVSVVGFSGAGKSNLLGFIAQRQPAAGTTCTLLDCNRLAEPSAAALFSLARRSLGGKPADGADAFDALDAAVAERLTAPGNRLALLFDRFDIFVENGDRALFNNLRALRDGHKFRLAYVIATRRPLPAHNELAELFLAHTLWLGPLSTSDARWNVARYAARRGVQWDDRTTQALIAASRGYASLLRAACEAYADGTSLDALAGHAAVQARVAELWDDHPTPDELRQCGLAGHPLLAAAGGLHALDPAQLTPKEHLLLAYLQAHPGEICEKDDLIHAVWPEDKVFERGVRDDSLAQLVRRLREKIEADPARPRLIQTVAGRGYRFRGPP